MMQAFTEGIDKIYCDLDGLQSRLCLESPELLESTTNNMKTFKTFENKVSRWVAEADSKFDQDVFNILSDMEAETFLGYTLVIRRKLGLSVVRR